MLARKSGRISTGTIAGSFHSTEWRLFLLPKSFKTIDEQIKILTSRGMYIDEKSLEYVKKYLLTNNYYSIINGYSKPFLEKENLYKSGTTFEEVCSLYLFDKDIKSALFDATLNVERHLKSIFAYRFAEAHQDETFAFLDVSSFNHNYSFEIAYIVNKLNKIIQKNKKYSNNSIYHYISHYHNVPIWVLVDFLDFGDLYTLIKVIPPTIQNKIAKDLLSFIKDNDPSFLGLFPSETMLSFIKNIHETRNVCAHNNRLIYFNCRSDSIYFEPLHSRYNISSDDSRKNTYATFISTQYFLSKTEYAKLHNTIRKKFRYLNNKLSTIDIEEIENLLGFPKQWYKTPKIEQN